jgi:4-diphosphocytidyl-2-C-methyl-D-erythritol kinase
VADNGKHAVTDRVRLVAPAKLTLSLRVVGRREGGYHELESEMVSLDLADTLHVDPAGHGLHIEVDPGARGFGLHIHEEEEENLVTRALRTVGRTAGVRLEKRIPVRGGLGGGSTDAAAILRWAGVTDPAVASSLGADVPFCVAGGRAMVRGIGEQVTPLPFEARSFVLLVPPFGIDTGAVYRAWDYLEPEPGERPNDLEAAAVEVDHRLARWRDLFHEVVGRTPVLAGSGSTWFVEGTPEELGLAGRTSLTVGPDEGRLIAARTVPAGWAGDG